MKYRGLLLILLLAALLEHCFAHDRQVVGYYPNWQWYRRNQLVDPESIDYSNYTVINYAFFNPTASGSVQTADSWADENLLLGPMIWWPVEMHDSTRCLPYLAHQAGVKILPSIGGWTLSNNFPAIAADPVKRQTFAQSCVSLIQTYGFDGIDLDWEYPGFPEHNGSPADFFNFPLLLQDLRAALDALEAQTGADYLLTSCFNGSRIRMEDIDWPAVLPLVDMVNLMSYDYHGSWDALSNFNSPLYPPAVGDPEWCCSGSFEILTQEFNVPPGRINLGIPFYGKALANCSQLYGTHSGYDLAAFPLDEGQPHYYSILNALPDYAYHWDDSVKCPYLLGNGFNTFVSYDDTTSVGWKTLYAKEHGAGGVIIWEITGDYLETAPNSGIIAGTPLADKINSVFNLPDELLPPLDLTGQATADGIELQWLPSSMIPEIAYFVYRNHVRLNPSPCSAISYTDANVAPGQTYLYYVTSVYAGQESLPSNQVEVTATGSSNSEDILAPVLASLRPNPFPGLVSLAVNPSRNAEILWEVFDLRGRLVHSSGILAGVPGPHSYEWNAIDGTGREFPPGIYIFRLKQRETGRNSPWSETILRGCFLRP